MEKTRNEWDQTIINHALKGESGDEISRKLHTDKASVEYFINTLGKENHPNYDLETYQQIQMERNLNHRVIEDKDFLDDAVSLVLSGFTYLEIASMFEGKTEDDVIECINKLNGKDSVYYNPKLYEKVAHKNLENIEKNEEKIFKRLDELVKSGIDLKTISNSRLLQKYTTDRKIRNMMLEYLDFNMSLSDQYLATKYNFTKHTISEIFNRSTYENTILKVIDKETLQKIREYRKQNSMQKSKEIHEKIISYGKELTKEEKAKLEKIESQLNLWFPMLFAFKLSIEDLGIITNFDKTMALKKSVYTYADKIYKPYYNSLNYLLTYSIATQEEERKKRIDAATNFLENFTYTQIMGTKEEKQEMMNWLTDSDVKKILKSKKTFNKLTEEEKRRIIEYRIKYALPLKVFPYTQQALMENTPEEYKDEMERISYFNDQCSKASFVKNQLRNNYSNSQESFGPKR